ncbi:hypothetical protein GM609_01475 [Bombella sp. ESL0387]|nr:hypothetical protein [Bombella sp. ESL0387]
MQIKAICLMVVTIIIAGMAAAVLRLTWRASREKAARQQRNDARTVTEIQAQASQAATDACNTDGQLEEALGNGTF